MSDTPYVKTSAFNTHLWVEFVEINNESGMIQYLYLVIELWVCHKSGKSKMTEFRKPLVYAFDNLV